MLKGIVFFLWLFILPSLIFSRSNRSQYTNLPDYTYPPNFKCKHDYLWLGWASKGIPSFARGYPLKPFQIQMIQKLSPYVKIRLIVNNDEEVKEVKNYLDELNPKFDFSRIEIIKIKHIDIWMRDFGPVFLVPTNKKAYDRDTTLKIVHFGFTNFGMDPSKSWKETRVKENLRLRIAKYLGVPLRKASPFVTAEGGGMSVNGEGLMMIVRSVEKQRNPKYSIEELKKIYKKYYGVKKIIVLEKGVVEDDHPNTRLYDGKHHFYTAFGVTNGHIDEFCRFVNSRTILISYVSEKEIRENKGNLILLENYKRMRENYQILKLFAKKNPQYKLRIIRIPMPELRSIEVFPEDIIYQDFKKVNFINHKFPFGSPVKILVASSYMNFVLSNDVILLPQFYDLSKKGTGNKDNEKMLKKDLQAMKILQNLFPKKKVIGMSNLPAVIGGGGFNCMSQQQPNAKCFVNKKFRYEDNQL